MHRFAPLISLATLSAIAVNAWFWDRCFDPGTGFYIALWNIPAVTVFLFLTWHVKRDWPTSPLMILSVFWISELLYEVSILHKMTDQYGLHNGIEAQGSGFTKLLIIILTFLLSITAFFISWFRIREQRKIWAQQDAAANP